MTEKEIRIHDCFVSVHGRAPTEEELSTLCEQVPEKIVHTANEWGWNDTVVGDDVYTWIKGRNGKKSEGIQTVMKEAKRITGEKVTYSEGKSYFNIMPNDLMDIGLTEGWDSNDFTTGLNKWLKDILKFSSVYKESIDSEIRNNLITAFDKMYDSKSISKKNKDWTIQMVMSILTKAQELQ